MNEIKKRYISFVLLFAMIFATVSNCFIPNYASAEEINKQVVIKEEKDFVLKEDENGIRYIYLKTVDISQERFDEIYKISEEGVGENRTVGTVISGIALVVLLYDTFLKPSFDKNREDEIRLKSVQNGWIDITHGLETMWYYKIGGIFKEGWHYDDGYKGWYYFFPQGENSFMFDPRFSPSSWIRINNKWYDFNIGGKLKELQGWEMNNGKWMFHIHGDYGALAGAIAKIGKKWYWFDSDGYMIGEFDYRPNIEALKES